MNVVQANFSKTKLPQELLDIEVYDLNGNKIEVELMTPEEEEKELFSYIFAGIEKAEDGNEVPIYVNPDSIEEYKKLTNKNIVIEFSIIK